MVPNGSFFSFYCHFYLIWENLAPSLPPPQDFDEITPLGEPPPMKDNSSLLRFNVALDLNFKLPSPISLTVNLLYIFFYVLGYGYLTRNTRETELNVILGAY